MAEKRNFVLMKGGKDTDSIFTGRAPRQAALKAANRNITDIRLRERGTKKVHLFKGARTKVAAPSNAPSWMGDKVWKPSVKKVGIERLDAGKKKKKK
ncbi:MAG: non-histone chromosomal MC1 family protein [archaeon]